MAGVWVWGCTLERVVKEASLGKGHVYRDLNEAGSVPSAPSKGKSESKGVGVCTEGRDRGRRQARGPRGQQEPDHMVLKAPVRTLA